MLHCVQTKWVSLTATLEAPGDNRPKINRHCVKIKASGTITFPGRTPDKTTNQDNKRKTPMTVHPEAESWPLEDTPTLDRGVLTAHINDLGAELVRQIAEKYLDDAPSSVAAVRAALEAQDLPLLRKLIHRLGGGAQTVGLAALSAQARKAEHALRQGHNDEGIREATRLLARVGSDLAVLDEFRASLKG